MKEGVQSEKNFLTGRKKPFPTGIYLEKFQINNFPDKCLRRHPCSEQTVSVIFNYYFFVYIEKLYLFLWLLCSFLVESFIFLRLFSGYPMFPEVFLLIKFWRIINFFFFNDFIIIIFFKKIQLDQNRKFSILNYFFASSYNNGKLKKK